MYTARQRERSHWRSQDFVLRRPENRVETPKASSEEEGRLGGLRERRKLPQRGQKRILVHFEL